jgi:hypothetical protein
LLHLFGFVNHLSAEVAGECAGEGVLVLGIACLDVVVGDGIEEVALVVIHKVVEPAARGQPLVAVGVGRVCLLRGAPVGLQCLFDDLVAHESDVEPVLYFFVSCHISVIFIIVSLFLMNTYKKILRAFYGRKGTK